MPTAYRDRQLKLLSGSNLPRIYIFTQPGQGNLGKYHAIFPVSVAKRDSDIYMGHFLLSIFNPSYLKGAMISLR